MNETPHMIRCLRGGWVAGLALAIPLSSGAQQVVNLSARDMILAGKADVVYAVGVEEGEDWQVFSNIAGVSFDGSGNLYVLDRDNARVVVIGPDGKFVRTVGKKGGGPGEFQLPMGVAALSDGRLAVYDMASGGISVFDRNGAYATLVRPASEFGRTRGDPFMADATGAVLLAGSQISMIGPGSPPQVRDSLPILRVATDASGATRLLFNAPNPAPRMNVSGDANRREVRVNAPPEFSPQVSWAALSDGGLVVSTGSDYDLLIVRDGKVGRTLKRPITARRVTDRDMDLARRNRRTQLETGAGMMRVENVGGRTTMSAGGGMPRQQVEQMLASMEFAQTVPVVRRVRADRDGRIWVERDGGPGSEDYPIDILKAGGSYVGTVRGMALPNAFGPDGLVAFIESDDLGVQRVVVRRIPADWRK